MIRELEEIEPAALESLPNASRWRQVGGLAVKAACALGLSTLGVMGLGDSEIQTDRLGIRIEAESVIELGMRGDVNIDTSVGDVRFDSHDGPLGINLEIADIPLEATLERFQNIETFDELPSEVREDLDQIDDKLRLHTYKNLAILALGSLAGWTIGEHILRTKPNSWRLLRKTTGHGLVAAAVVAGSVGGAGAWSRNNNAIKNPSFSGGLAYARDNADVVQLLDEHDERVARTTRHFLQLVEAVRSFDDEELRPATCLLVVADIHSRNIFSHLKFFTENTCVDGIVNAGDTTEWGSDVESEFFTDPGATSGWRGIQTEIADLGVPFLIVKGNHDSEATMQSLAQIPNVLVLDGQVETVNNLEIVGLPDPLYTPDDFTDETEANRETVQEQLGRDLRKLARDKHPEVVVVHNPIAAREVRDGTSIVISGHTHVDKPQMQRFPSGTLHYNQGSSGGAGLRLFETTSTNENSSAEPRGIEKPQTFSILYFDQLGHPYQADEYIIHRVNGDLRLEMEPRDLPCNEACRRGW